MNKLLIVLLAVCLFSVVSAHTFVKRDAPVADDLKAKLDSYKDKITEQVNNVGKKISENINPEVIKKNFNKLVDGAHTFVKRDAPVADDTKAQLDLFKEKVTEQVNNVVKQISENIKPEVIKKNFNEFVDGVTKTFDNFKPATGEAKPAAATQ